MVKFLSRFHGIPTTKNDGLRQYSKIARENFNRPYYRGRYLVLKKIKKGKYKGCFGVYLYETKPKSKRGKIRMRKL